MIATTPQEERTRAKFHRKLRKYIQRDGAMSSRVAQGGRRRTTTLGELVQIGEDDIIHLFNNEAMLAISHAIEDLAGEVREGELITTFQKIENFMHQKDRYVSLSKDLDAVRVWADGEPPKRCGNIDFIPIFRPDIARYWVVLFASPRASAVLICRQVNNTDDFASKVFAGFYSFNPFLVESIRRNFNLVSCGLDGVVHRWEKEMRLPSISMSDVNRIFKNPRG